MMKIQCTDDNVWLFHEHLYQAHHFLSYAPNFEKVDGAYCFWSVGAWVGHTFVPTVTFKPLKLES